MEEGFIQREGKGSCCPWGDIVDTVQFLATLDIFHQDDYEEKDERIKATWRKRCFEKMDNHSVHTIPPDQNECSPKQQRRPLPSLLSYLYPSAMVQSHLDPFMRKSQNVLNVFRLVTNERGEALFCRGGHSWCIHAIALLC